MTEEEAKNALFRTHQEYMSHTPKERLKLYDDYIKRRNEIKQSLVKSKLEESSDKTK